MNRYDFALLAASAAVLCCVMWLSISNFHSDPESGVSIDLVHGRVAVRASSFSGPLQSENFDFAEIIAITSSINAEDVIDLSEEIFMKNKFSVAGSHSNRTSAHFSTRKLRFKSGDKQFFVQFSIPADIYTLAALGKFTGQRVVSHVHDNLFVVIGSEASASKARQFPGVSWVQERISTNKFGINLKQELDRLAQENGYTRLRRRFLASSRISDSNPAITLMAQCWFDSCGTAALNVQPFCSDVYVHAGLIEVQCSVDMVTKAVTLLADQIGIEHIDVKEIMETKNFAGRAILGTGPLATDPSQSLVLSHIDMSNAVIGVADTGINMNNCFFYDGGKIGNSRVVLDYTYLPGSMCGRQVPCGNMLDEQGHGTHVAGTVCGNAGPNAAASVGNGIAVGAKVFFQDIHSENILSPPSNLANLFQPAYDAGVYVRLPNLFVLTPAPFVCAAFFSHFVPSSLTYIRRRRVHTNSWGCRPDEENPFKCNTYNSRSQDVDAFV
jgi:hypothetical protein